ncbi:MAG: D-aminoacyl-tRNA deacylase [Isosphaeraceae bacterium]
MRAVLQRVSMAEVRVEGDLVGSIAAGWLVLVGVADGDQAADSDWLADKVANLRAFADGEGKMNRNVKEAGGAVLVVSQFTLVADCRKGRRPGFDAAARPQDAERLYLRVADRLRFAGLEVATGKFRADMKVELVNDGPVTFLLDSRKAF